MNDMDELHRSPCWSSSKKPEEARKILKKTTEGVPPSVKRSLPGELAGLSEEAPQSTKPDFAELVAIDERKVV